jgi:hypothetical protein
MFPEMGKRSARSVRVDNYFFFFFHIVDLFRRSLWAGSGKVASP